VRVGRDAEGQDIGEVLREGERGCAENKKSRHGIGYMRYNIHPLFLAIVTTSTDDVLCPYLLS